MIAASRAVGRGGCVIVKGKGRHRFGPFMFLFCTTFARLAEYLFVSVDFGASCTALLCGLGRNNVSSRRVWIIQRVHPWTTTCDVVSPTLGIVVLLRGFIATIPLFLVSKTTCLPDRATHKVPQSSVCAKNFVRG